MNVEENLVASRLHEGDQMGPGKTIETLILTITMSNEHVQDRANWGWNEEDAALIVV